MSELVEAHEWACKRSDQLRKERAELMAWWGKKLRAARIKRGLSLREVARRAKLSAPFISDIELGRRNPSPASMGRIVSALEEL